MMPADIPPAIRERVVCSVAAASKYGVPANILLAVAQREGGKPGQWVRNTNATYDIGSMQFNTSYIRTLARYGINAADVAKAGCFSYDLAAWRIRGHIKNDRGDIWTRVANYHSRTPRFNARYRAGIIANARYWSSWLSARFPTYDSLTIGPQTIATVNAAPVSRAPVLATRTPSPVSRTTVVYSRPTAAYGPSSYVPRSIVAVE